MQRQLKRALDLLGALLLSILFAPLILCIAIALRLRNGAPVIFREARYGRGGEPFTLVKFRTLRPGTGASQSVAAEDDQRIEPLGHFLRRWRLDEFPQLANIARGEMSLVGPRPLPGAHAHTVAAEVLAELGSFAPGLTGPAALHFLAEDAVLAGRADAEQLYLTVVLPAKLAEELDYVRHWSLAADARILGQTVLSVWSPRARRRSQRLISTLIDQRRSDPLGG
jgi:lipopolysaccharide/colanic/teichoic acid biosynthesis glycosyltransferase